jgi:hypothetical protein
MALDNFATPPDPNEDDQSPPASGGTRQSHGDLLRASQRRKLDAMFAGRMFDVVRPVHLPPGQVFVTFLGHRGRHGWVIKARDDGQQLVVGATLLRLIHDRYLAVTLPAKRRHRPDRAASSVKVRAKSD